MLNFILKLRNNIVVDKKNIVNISNKSRLRNCKIKIRGRNNVLEIKDGVNLNGVIIEIRGENCKISIDTGTIIGKNTYLSAREKNINIMVGKNCMFSRNIKIMTCDGHNILENKLRINPSKNIEIKDDVWIADNVTLLKGIVVETGSVLGINSTVTKSVPKNSIVAGNPAKIVKENITWERELG